MSGKILYEVSSYFVTHDASGDPDEELGISALTYDLGKAKLLADYSVRQFGCARAEVTFRDEDGEEEYVYEILPLGDYVIRDGFELHFIASRNHFLSIASVPLRYSFSGSLTNPKCRGDYLDDILF